MARFLVAVERHADVRADAVAVPLVAAVRRVGQVELEAAEAGRDVDQLLRVLAVVHADAGRVRAEGGESGGTVGVGAPLVRREGGEVSGAARRQDAGSRQRVVGRAHAHFAEAAGEIDPGFVDLIVAAGRSVILALELDAGTDLEAVVENGRTGEVDFRVGEHAVGVALVAGLAFAVVVEGRHVGGAEEAADAELDAVRRQGGGGDHPGTEQSGASQQGYSFHWGAPSFGKMLKCLPKRPLATRFKPAGGRVAETLPGPQAISG